MSEQEFLEYLQTRTHLYLYGAGIVAKRVLRFCHANNINVEGIVVTERDDDFTALFGIPVMSLEELQNNSVIDILQVDLLVCVKVEPYGGTCSWNDDLFDISFRSRFVLPPKINGWLREEENQYDIDQIVRQLVPCKVDANNKNMEQNHLVMLDDKDKLFCRCETSELKEQVEDFNGYCTREVLASLYGKFSIIPFEGMINVKQTESYVVMCHLDKVLVEDIASEGYIPIQVGAALTDIRKGCQTDNTGENISRKNRDYSECTAIYWIWKNTSGQEYVGINHYRRRLLLDETSIDYVKTENIDVVFALPHFCVTSVREFFMRFVSKHDWQLMKEKIELLYPEYSELWEEYENAHFYFHGNLALWKREWFDKYCEFAFSITEQIEAEYEKRGIIRQDRYMGFLFENLTSFYAMTHRDEMKIACTQMKWIDTIRKNGF